MPTSTRARCLSLVLPSLVSWTMACGTSAPGPSAHDHPDSAVAPADVEVAPTDVPVAPTDVPVAPTDAPPRTLQALNDCAPDGSDVVDMTGMANPVVVSGSAPEGHGFVFTPKCVRLRVGQALTFRIDQVTAGTWQVHPLRAGWIEDGSEVADPSSPIPFRDEGEADVQVAFTTGGTYPFYCTRHYLTGHVGAVHVVDR